MRGTFALVMDGYVRGLLIRRHHSLGKRRVASEVWVMTREQSGGLFAKFCEPYIQIQTSHVIQLRVGIITSRGWQKGRAPFRAGYNYRDGWQRLTADDSAVTVH